MSYSLQKVQAPECPKCGCNATTIIGAGTHGTRAWARFSCDFCDSQFVIGADPTIPKEVNGVIEVPVRCPRCQSTKVPVQNTQKLGRAIKRHRTCGNCGQLFSSTSTAV